MDDKTCIEILEDISLGDDAASEEKAINHAINAIETLGLIRKAWEASPLGKIDYALGELWGLDDTTALKRLAGEEPCL
jgi:hypothetical protein